MNRNVKEKHRGMSDFLTVIFCIAVIFTGTLFCIKPICSSVINQVFLEEAIQSRVLDAIYKKLPEMETSQLQSISDAVIGNKALEQYTKDILDEIAASVQEDKEFTLPESSLYFQELNEELLQTIITKVNIPLTEEQQSQLGSKLMEYTQKVPAILDEVTSQIISRGDIKLLTLIKMYHIVNSEVLKVISFAVILLLGAGVFCLRRKHHQWMTLLGSANIVAGVFVGLLFPVAGSIVVTKIIQRIFGAIPKISLDAFYMAGGIIFLIGLIILILKRLITPHKGQR